MPTKSHWTARPKRSEFAAARAFLELCMRPKEATRALEALRGAKNQEQKAEDIARASGLPLLPVDNADVAKYVQRLRQGKRLPPVLLIRGRLSDDVPLRIADGYHRLSASYCVDEEAQIVCR